MIPRQQAQNAWNKAVDKVNTWPESAEFQAVLVAVHHHNELQRFSASWLIC
jgi:hypothetical protein